MLQVRNKNVVSPRVWGWKDKSIQNEPGIWTSGTCWTLVLVACFVLDSSVLSWGRKIPLRCSLRVSGCLHILLTTGPTIDCGSSLFFFPPSFFFSFSFTTANDEVTVYFPTGRCLGDASLSAERWRNLQFLPTWVESWGQSVKSCRTWRHVFRALCVFHRCALFLTCTKATRVNTSLESVTLMPRAACLGYDIISQCVLFKPAYSWKLLKHPVLSMSDGEARASNLLGGVSMSHICSMSKTCFYLNAHWQHVGLQDHSLPTHMHTFTV